MNNLAATFVAMFLALWCVLLTVVSIQMERVLSVQQSSIDQLSRIVEKQGALIDWHGRRITQLERPDEPVHPPRNPGRLGQIGSAD